MPNQRVTPGGGRVPLSAGSQVVGADGTTLGPAFTIAGQGYLSVQANFTYGSAGTTLDVYVQMSLDGGSTWCDVMNFHFTTASARLVQAIVASTALAAHVTPTDGAIASNTILSGLFGSLLRIKTVAVGSYVGSSYEVDGCAVPGA